MKNRFLFVLLALLIVALAGCAAPAAPAAAPSGAEAAPAPAAAAEAAPTAAPAEEGCAEMTPVKLQLQWVTQSQFAGYFAAVDQGFYEEQCLDVTILEGAVDIVPVAGLTASNTWAYSL